MPSYTDPKYNRTYPVAEYNRFNQVADEAARNYGSHGIPTAFSLAQAGQSTAQLIQAVDEMDAQIRAAIRSLPQNASTIPVRLASEEPPETDEETGPEGKPLSPQDEINRAEYNAAFNALKTLDPNNPALTTLTGPDYVPSDAAIAHVREVLARVQRQGPDTAADEKADKRPSTQLMLPGEPLMDQLRHPPKFELEPRPQDVEKPAATSVPPIVSPREEPNSPALRLTVSRENREHILVGKSKKGGHRFGQNTAGKTEFPPNWFDDRIIDEIESVANDPKSSRYPGYDGRTIVRGSRDCVDMVILVDSDGKTIKTGYPTNTRPNPKGSNSDLQRTRRNS